MANCRRKLFTKSYSETSSICNLDSTLRWAIVCIPHIFPGKWRHPSTCIWNFKTRNSIFVELLPPSGNIRNNVIKDNGDQRTEFCRQELLSNIQTTEQSVRENRLYMHPQDASSHPPRKNFQREGLWFRAPISPDGTSQHQNLSLITGKHWCNVEWGAFKK